MNSVWRLYKRTAAIGALCGALYSNYAISQAYPDDWKRKESLLVNTASGAIIGAMYPLTITLYVAEQVVDKRYG